MIIPPFASPEDYTNAIHPIGEKEACWFIFSKDQLLIHEDKSLPNTNHYPLFKKELYLGTLSQKHLFATEIETQAPPPQGWRWCSLRSLYGVIRDDHYAIAGRAMQLLSWDRTHKFCGSCGKETFIRETERCRECPSCGHLAYPKLAPAIIVLIKKEDKILLARSPHFPEKFYSVLAGYVDPGETLEQCVTREVLEEVGLKVTNIRYFGSQPWPFSQSLMIAFTCDWQAGEISINPTEICEAGWFDQKNLPLLPPRLSISRMLIDSYLSNL